MNDHDLLIKLDQKMTDMCNTMKMDSANNVKAHDDILLKIDGQQKCIVNQGKTFVTARLFYWLVGFIIIALLGLSGLSADNNYKIGKIETKLEMQKRINPPVYFEKDTGSNK